MSSAPQGFPAASSPGDATNFRDMAEDYAATAKEQWDNKSLALKTFIVNKPVMAIGLSLGMGVALGWLIKRR